MFDKQLANISRTLYADLDTPISLGVYLRQKYGEWDDFLAMRISPDNYLDTSLGALKFAKDVQAIDLLRKYPKLPIKGLGEIRRKAALDNFWIAEKQCKATNDRLLPLLLNFGLDPRGGRIRTFVESARRKISKILGKLPPRLDLKHGPGVTFEWKGGRHAITAADKMSFPPHVTPACVPLVGFIYETAWGRHVLNCPSSAPVVVRGNRFTTVPKDSQRDRGICIEPGGNVSLQLALGKYIRRRLYRFGIDLDNGQNLHRAKAREGSFSNEIATLDLSNASDTVALNLVKLLLPEEWFEALNALRSPFTLVPVTGQGERWVRLEKFSSMGNGFTFELETLIFAVLTAEAADGKLGEDIFCYGDDIIYPSVKTRDVMAVLKYFGFTPNPRKSFSTGPFRESCGGDYFLGFPVRSYFLDFEPNEPSHFISLHNGLWRASRQYLGDFFRRARTRTVALLPSDIRRCRGPAELGDLVLTNPDPETWTTITRNGIRFVRVWRPVLQKRYLYRYPPSVQLAVALYGAATGISSNYLQECLRESHDAQRRVRYTEAYLTPRNAVEGYRFGRVAYS